MRASIHLVMVAGVWVSSATAAPAQSIFTNPITGTDPGLQNPYTTGQVVASNLTVGGIGQGAGISGAAASDRYNATSWNTATLDTTAYFTWTLAPNSGYKIDFTSLVYASQRSSSGPTSLALRSSLDGFSTDISTPLSTGGTVSLSAIQDVESSIEFRLYGWNASDSAGTFSVNSFTFNGSVSPVPEPASVLAAAAVGLGVLRLRRRLV